jgi:hypothetical protein
MYFPDFNIQGTVLQTASVTAEYSPNMLASPPAGRLGNKYDGRSRLPKLEDRSNRMMIRSSTDSPGALPEYTSKLSLIA